MHKPYDILLKNTQYLTPDMAVARGDIALAGSRIAALLPPGSGAPALRTLEASHRLWMPGLVDGHIHTSQQLLRGRLLDEKPVIWKRVNVPFECRLDPESSRLSAQLAALEMIRCGTTGFIDAGGKYPEEFAQVYAASGLRGRLTYFTNDHAPAPLGCGVSEGVERLRGLRGALTGRLRGYFSVTALTAASAELFHTVFRAAAETGTPVEVHMNEYASEVTDFLEQYGQRPFVYLEQEGLLEGVTFVAPHCIFLSPEEMEILRRRRVQVIHCPFSNCGKGVPDTPQLLARGVSVGFGSDGAAHGGLDLFREMRLFRGVMNATRGTATADSCIMPARTLLTMATQGGAAALGEPQLGRIAPDAPADLIAIDIDQPHLWPSQDLVNTLVECASGQDVADMIVDGRMVMEDRHILTLDEEEIRFSARRLLERHPHLARWP